MKKLLAFLCSVMIFSGAVVMQTGIVPARAQYTAEELENAIASAAQWSHDHNDPLGDIGAEDSDINVVAFARAGINYDYDTYLYGLDSVAEAYSDSDPITSMQHSLMAVSALGGDSGYFGGRDFAGDSTYYRNLGSVEEYIGALTAINAGNIDIPYDTGLDRGEFIRHILSYQKSDGSFGEVRTTAAAIIALAEDYNSVEYTVTYSDDRGPSAVTCETAVNDALGYLASRQSNAGDFYSLTDTAMVALAMDAVGTGQQDERFVKNGNTVMDGILIYRTDNGGFSEVYGEDTDALATSYALSAMVSNARVLQGKAKFFDFASSDAITMPAVDLKTTTSTSPSTTATTRPTTRPTTTIRPTTKPTSTTRPATTARPRTTTNPSSTAMPSASPDASGAPIITPSPTRRPDLVGPAQLVGPIPSMTPRPGDDADSDSINRERGNVAIPVTVGVIAILAAAAALLIFMAKKKLWIFKKSEKPEIYHAKQHRRTEEHRHYEERRKFEDRRKYAQRGKYKGRK